MVSIVDGLPILDQLPDEILKDESAELTRWDFRYKKMYKQFKSKGMRMITAHEYAVLMQLSLENYKKAKEDPQHKHHLAPEKEIVDFYTNESQVVTVFYQPESLLTNIKKVPYGYFAPGLRMIVFSWSHPGYVSGSLRGRGSVQVFSL